jgi:hypothetical protein
MDSRRKALERGMPKNTCRLTEGGEMKIKNNTWETVEKMAKDRQKWRTFVAALHANGISGSFTFFFNQIDAGDD